jgi:hypothetical protein
VHVLLLAQMENSCQLMLSLLEMLINNVKSVPQLPTVKHAQELILLVEKHAKVAQPLEVLNIIY